MLKSNQRCFLNQIKLSQSKKYSQGTPSPTHIFSDKSESHLILTWCSWGQPPLLQFTASEEQFLKSCFICSIFNLTTMHFIGRVTMLFANNSLMECLITMKFLHIFFLHPDVIFSSHTMLINASTEDFTPIHLVTLASDVHVFE